MQIQKIQIYWLIDWLIMVANSVSPNEGVAWWSCCWLSPYILFGQHKHSVFVSVIVFLFIFACAIVFVHTCVICICVYFCTCICICFCNCFHIWWRYTLSSLSCLGRPSIQSCWYIREIANEEIQVARQISRCQIER